MQFACIGLLTSSMLSEPEKKKKNPDSYFVDEIASLRSGCKSYDVCNVFYDYVIYYVPSLVGF